MKAVLASVLLLAALVTSQKQHQQQTKPDKEGGIVKILSGDQAKPSKVMISESKPIYLKSDVTMIKTNSLNMLSPPIKATSNQIHVIDNPDSESQEYLYKILNDQKQQQLKDQLLMQGGSVQPPGQDPYEKVKFVAVLSVMGSVLLATLIMTMYLCLKNEKFNPKDKHDPHCIKA